MRDLQLEEFIAKGGERITTVLSPYNGYGKIKQKVLDRAAARGSRVHEILEDFIKGTKTWDHGEGVKGYLSSFMCFWNDMSPKYEIIEKRFYDYEDMLTGKIDFYGTINRKKVIVDWKTSSTINPTYGMQGSAYATLMSKFGYQVDEVLFVMLKKDGSCPEIMCVEPSKYLEDFKECRSVYKKYFKYQINNEYELMEEI